MSQIPNKEGFPLCFPKSFIIHWRGDVLKFLYKENCLLSGSGFCGGVNLNLLCRPAIGYAINFFLADGLLSSFLLLGQHYDPWEPRLGQTRHTKLG